MDPEEKNPKPIEESEMPASESLSSSLKQIRTFQGDVATALKTQNESLVSIQRAEVKRNDERRVSLPPTEEQKNRKRSVRRAIMLIIGTLILVSLGTVGVWYSYKEYRIKTAAPQIVEVPNMFFHTDTLLHNDASIITRQSLIQAIRIEKQNPQAPLIEQFQLHTSEGDNAPLLSTEGFLAILESHAPASLIRSFDSLFMLGIIGQRPRHTYLLIKLDSFENAFPGMLEWENTLPDDLLPLFSFEQEDASATSTPQILAFTDATIQNRDVRVLKDQSTGKTVLLYSFFDNSILIITDSEETLQSIVTRLNSEKLTR
jgi:hypothetical protein